MDIGVPFRKLPFLFDAARLAEEVAQFSDSDYIGHPNDFTGNDALILVSSEGGKNHRFDSPMLPTAELARCPYIKQIMTELGVTIGRSRIMRLAPGKGVDEHFDVNYYWFDHVRIHIPVMTHQDIRFFCLGESAHFGAGECWVVNNWAAHHVENTSSIVRTHLVIDTVGNSRLWDLINNEKTDNHYTGYDPQAKKIPVYENRGSRFYLTTPKLKEMEGQLKADVGAGAVSSPFFRYLENFIRDWNSVEAASGDMVPGSVLKQCLAGMAARQKEFAGELNPKNGGSLLAILRSWLSFFVPHHEAVSAPVGQHSKPAFDRPIFIVGSPRSGTTLLFETLAKNRELWTIGGEAHGLIESIPSLHPSAKNYDSNVLTEADCNQETAEALQAAFRERLRDHQGRTIAGRTTPAGIRFLEKTPKNSLRIGFLKKVFPGAKFIFLYREGRPNVASIVSAWQSGRFVTYPDLPGRTSPWSLALVPGWRSLGDSDAGLMQTAVYQWRTINETIVASLDPGESIALRYEDFLNDTAYQLERLCAFMEIPFGKVMKETATGPLPHSRHTLDAPAKEKWRRLESELLPYTAEIDEVTLKLNDFAGRTNLKTLP